MAATQLATVASGLRRVMLRWLVAILAGVVWQLVSRGTWKVAERLMGTGERRDGPVSPALPTLRGRLSPHEAQLSSCLVAPAFVPERLRDVGGLDLVKSDLVSAIVVPLSHPRAFFGSHLFLAPSRGVTLVGPPGTGKTMLARALAAEAGANLRTVTVAAMEDEYYGESSKLLRADFSLALKAQPCVLFFDEIDGLMRERSAAEGSASYGLKTEFLGNMDSLQASDAVVVIGSTNNLALLDPAVKHRLPKVYHIGKPGASDRVRILELLLQQEPEAVRGLSDRARALLLRGTDGCTGSDMQELYRTAAGARLAQQLRQAGFAQQLEAAADPSSLVDPIGDGDWAHTLGALLTGQANANRSYCSGSAPPIATRTPATEAGDEDEDEDEDEAEPRVKVANVPVKMANVPVKMAKVPSVDESQRPSAAGVPRARRSGTATGPVRVPNPPEGVSSGHNGVGTGGEPQSAEEEPPSDEEPPSEEEPPPEEEG